MDTSQALTLGIALLALGLNAWATYRLLGDRVAPEIRFLSPTRPLDLGDQGNTACRASAAIVEPASVHLSQRVGMPCDGDARPGFEAEWKLHLTQEITLEHGPLLRSAVSLQGHFRDRHRQIANVRDLNAAGEAVGHGDVDRHVPDPEPDGVPADHPCRVEDAQRGADDRNPKS